MQTKKKVPGRFDPHEVQVADGHQTNGEVDEVEHEEGLQGAEDQRFVGDDDQEL